MVERIKALVECYSGARYGERPLALFWEGKRYEIAGIQRQWRLPEGPCYRVITQEEEKFDLIYLQVEDEWRIFSLV
jgi:hypothetical protein